MKMPNFSAVIERCRQNREFRNWTLMMIFLVVITLLIIPEFLWKLTAEKDLSKLTERYREFSLLAGEYRSLNQRVQTIEKKEALTSVKGIAQIVGEISESLGMKGKVQSIKETGTRKTLNQMREETAEVQIDKLNMTEMMHLLYKIENAPTILAVKKVQIKKSFENPDVLDVTMTLSLFTRERPS